MIRNLVIAGLIGGALGGGIVLLLRPAPPANLVSVVCSNSKGDAGSLNHAITHSHSGAEVLISGTCNLTKPVVLLGGRSYVGASRTGTILQTQGALPYLLASDSYADSFRGAGQPFTLRDLSIECNHAAVGLMLRTAQVEVEDLQITGCVNAGLEDTSRDARGDLETTESPGGTFRDLNIQRCGTGFLVSDSSNKVINSTLSDSTVTSSIHTAIELDNADGWVIQGNHLSDDGGDGIAAVRMFSTRIADNYIEDFADHGGTAVGIAGELEPSAVSEVTGNEVLNVPGGVGDYIRLTVSSGTGRVDVGGNEVLGNGSGTGFSYIAGSGRRLSVASYGNSAASVAAQTKAGKGVTITK